MPTDEEPSSKHVQPISLEELLLKRKREQEELSRVTLKPSLPILFIFILI